MTQPPARDEPTPRAVRTEVNRALGPANRTTQTPPAGVRQGRVHWTRRWFSRVSLRQKLVAITVLLLTLGMGIIATSATAIVSAYLTGELDGELQRAATAIASGQQAEPTARSGPTEYYVALRTADGKTAILSSWQDTLSRYGEPRLPTTSVPPARLTDPVTVDAVDGPDGSRWRMVAAPSTIVHSGEAITVFVALPLGDIHQTVQVLTVTLLCSAAAIVILGGTVAHLLVRRTLRPLRQIEATAADIAAGDLSRRVPVAPATTEVGSLSASLNTMLSQIEVAFAAQEASEARMRQFVSDASHELRTPLATVRGYGELYRMGALNGPGKVEDTMRRIEDAAIRMGTLVGDLLALARLDEGRPLARESVDLVALARDSVQDLHALDPSRAVRVTGLDQEQAPAAVIVEGDSDRLRQVFANLIGNVARHTPAGTACEIAVGSSHGEAVLEVRDHGPGISPDHAQRIFERFFRVDSSRNRSSGGSGLGMAIVSAIVAAHGGTVAVTQTNGGGLTVVLRMTEREYDGEAASDKSHRSPRT